MENKNTGRVVKNLKYGWKFIKEDILNGFEMNLEDSDWDNIRVPHDWAIYGPFSSENDKQIKEVTADGVLTPMVHIGRTGGLPVSGTAWYRKRLNIPADYKDKRIYIEFDGVMSNSEVYLNGKRAGGWLYGYTSYTLDVTEFVNFGASNILAVRVSPKPCASRWYPGAGIYRNVRMVVKDNVHVGFCGTCVTMHKMTQDSAEVQIVTEINNQNIALKTVILETKVIDPSGREIAQVESTTLVGCHKIVSQTITIERPEVWDIISPKLYKVLSIVRVEGEITDQYSTDFGLRTIGFDDKEGFFLNGRHVKLKGVCMHHDLGAIGTAVNRRAIERQLEILSKMGCNAIRTSHNPPAPEFLELCDRMGFLVIDEAFDEWRIPKVDNGYATIFDEWAGKDLEMMIKRDRNHPCIIMWSIGNEILDQRFRHGAQTAEKLTAICHGLDKTRPVTAGFNHAVEAIENGLAGRVDIPGWNYKPDCYTLYHEKLPGKPMYGSETASCVSSRGEYFLPAVEEKPVILRKNLHVSSYDMAAPPWAYPPEYEFSAQDDCPFILGEFVWTGFDYLGEPTPYREEWPSRSSYFGIVDLSGIPKDRYYSYQSKWTDQPVLHIFPHWNWERMDGKNIPVHCYTNAESVELFVNGKSVGKRKKEGKDTFTRYRMIWDEVKYEPGVLEAVAYGTDGRIVNRTQIKTAGEPFKITLIPDRCAIEADGDDLCYITVRVEDREGVLCPHACNEILFHVSGAGEFLAADNGDPTSMEFFHHPVREVFHGQCVMIVRTRLNKIGKITVSATADGLLSGTTSIDALLCI